jgi:3-phenylpropionate/trans-cinnamate dioxygenase ferredoxin component
MGDELRVGPASELPPGRVVGAGVIRLATRPGRCSPSVATAGTWARTSPAVRSTTAVGCAHASRYDVGTGRMVRGPQGIVAKVPGLGAANKLLTRVLPLRRGTVGERDGTLYVC